MSDSRPNEQAEPPGVPYRPERAILQLGDGFWDEVEPAEFPLDTLRFRNQRWARRVGLDKLSNDEWRAHFHAFEPLSGSLERPLALRYHGHQFRAYNPDLGDGRGFLFAQLRDDRDRLLDLGTKGSGRTPWSRHGDGRLTLKGGVREILATEMLEALGVDTSKSLSLFETGERLHRGDEPSPTRSSVLVRLSHSHIRIGTFQRCDHEDRPDRIATLIDYCLAHLLEPASEQPPEPEARAPALVLLDHVVQRSAQTCAAWMMAGFVHGVLNTDNLNVTGESFDYGPWRFLPRYDPWFIAAYFDHSGLYAFGRQPEAVAWNLERLADTLLDQQVAEFELAAVLRRFPERLHRAVVSRFLARLGVDVDSFDHASELLDSAFAFMQASRVGYDRFFFDWYGGLARLDWARASPAAQHYRGDQFDAFLSALERSGPSEHARERGLGHAYFCGEQPESMLIDEVEAIWSAIAERDDWSPLEAKVERVRRMGRAYGWDPTFAAGGRDALLVPSGP